MAVTLDQALEFFAVQLDSPLELILERKKELLLKWHPDKNLHQSELAEKHFKQIGPAFECITLAKTKKNTVPVVDSLQQELDTLKKEKERSLKEDEQRKERQLNEQRAKLEQMIKEDKDREKDRLERERTERERLERERTERERLERDRAEKERIHSHSFAHNSNGPHVPYPGFHGYPGYPGYTGYPGYPGYPGYASYPGHSSYPINHQMHSDNVNMVSQTTIRSEVPVESKVQIILICTQVQKKVPISPSASFTTLVETVKQKFKIEGDTFHLKASDGCDIEDEKDLHDTFPNGLKNGDIFTVIKH